MDPFESKRAEALRLLMATGIRESNYRPPILRLMWRLGFRVPPPNFMSFARVAGAAGVFVGVGWGAAMWLLQWRAMNVPLSVAFWGSTLVGVFFGLCMATYYAHGRMKHHLPPWNSLGTHD
ncbi:DUF6404 family protein [Hydrogenophaga soli]